MLITFVVSTTLVLGGMALGRVIARSLVAKDPQEGGKGPRRLRRRLLRPRRPGLPRHRRPPTRSRGSPASWATC